jgi:hypothetical protein
MGWLPSALTQEVEHFTVQVEVVANVWAEAAADGM